MNISRSARHFSEANNIRRHAGEDRPKDVIPRSISHPSDWTDEQWREWRPMIAGWCRARGRGLSNSDVDDCVQDVLVQLQKRSFGQRFDSGRGIEYSVYLRGTAKNVCRHALAAQRRRQYLPLFEHETHSDDPVRRLEQRELAQAIAEFCDALSPIELESLARILGRAEGRPISGRRRLTSTETGRDHRLRERLKLFLSRHV